MPVPHTQPSVKEPEILIDYEIEILLSKLKDMSPRDYMMIDLALATGLRNNEICNLKVETVHSYRIIPNILALPGSITKGGIARDIPLNEDIRNHLHNFLIWKEIHGEDMSQTSYLFVSKFTHKKLSPRDFQRTLSYVSLNSIGRSIHPHVLRHTFATRLLAVSNLSIVQKCLGHKNIQTTQIYLHPSNNEISLAIDRMSS